MKAPDEVSAMLRLKALGWGSKRIAAELGCSRNTVRHWLARSDWRPRPSRSRSRKLDGMSDWLRERFRQHAGNQVNSCRWHCQVNRGWRLGGR
jgi:transposase